MEDQNIFDLEKIEEIVKCISLNSQMNSDIEKANDYLNNLRDSGLELMNLNKFCL